MNIPTAGTWQLTEISSPHIKEPLQVIAAREIPYLAHSNRLQTLNIYLANSTESSKLVGSSVTSLPVVHTQSQLPQWHVHIHGGAWRDDKLTARSIEAAVAHAFSSENRLVTAVASINYTNSPFPNVPSWLNNTPYDAAKNKHSDPAREACHPQHVNDVLQGFAFLRSFGLTDGSYLLTGHSAGSCLAFQSILQLPSYYGLDDALKPPRPAAVIGMNGLYDLPGLVRNLGSTHEQLSTEYRNIFENAFGVDEDKWLAASPAHFNMDDIAKSLGHNNMVKLVVLDQSPQDQLVPMNQRDGFEAHLKQIDGLSVIRGNKCTGLHAAPWEQGYIIWDLVQDTMNFLAKCL